MCIRDSKQIDACWISHSHGDHFTLFPALQEHGVKFWTMDTIADKCENPRAYDYPAMIASYGLGFEGAKIDRILKAGDVIEWEGYKLHIDWMPGQTEFGNALWLELDGKRIVFTGAHGWLMTEPAAFVDRYHAWAQRIIRHYKELLPDENYEYLFDTYWVSA